MSSITVTTKEELKRAINEQYDEILVIGKLAKKVKKAEKIKTLSPKALAMISGLAVVGTGAAVAAPFTGGVSAAAFAAAAAPAAALSGLEVSVIAFIAFVGLTALSILFDNYTEVEVQTHPPKIKFERKR